MQHVQPVSRRGLLAVLLLLFVTGWAANHFAAMLPVLGRSEGFSRAVLDAAYGIYALGLVPALIGGGLASDQLGRRTLALAGASVAALGNVLLLCWHDSVGILAGRLVVGVGVGVAMSVGTAWSADLGGAAGAALAAVFLSAGLGAGPLVTGLTAQFASRPVEAPFWITIALSAAAVAIAFVCTGPAQSACGTSEADNFERIGFWSGSRIALTAALPMALLVFSSATVAIVTTAERMHYHYRGPWLPGVMSAVAMAAGVFIQAVSKRLRWGRAAGVLGAVAAAAGFTAMAAGGPTPSLPACLAVTAVLGIAYGLCMRAGLIDVETLTPRRIRGAVTGIFYAVTYFGFVLPLLLVMLEPSLGLATPLYAVATLAAGIALLRFLQIRGGSAVVSGYAASAAPPPAR
jgi:hypothetical protein